jgi:uncharacterized glyoxalase superfamily metalloenzyme YdcJ
VTRFAGPADLRASFARRMADMYGAEVPAYNTLVEVSAAVNADVLSRDGADAERLGSIARVTAERHGAIRVGTPRELRQVSRIFAALGMFPVGCYDLREAARSAVPVVSTAFRPVAPEELARNPFRMFTSVLITNDRRFFDADLQARLDAFLARRTLFPPELLELAERAIERRGLPAEDAERFLGLATASFALSAEPVDRGWYAELERVSAVAADIGGMTSTHINHLTPRVLDIDELYDRMSSRGVEMIDAIQGPPRWAGPDVLLRQTSFRALAEPRRFRESDGSVTSGALRVRFGEVEARGIALTPAGRDHYDSLLAEVDRRVREGAPRREAAEELWAERMPRTEQELLSRGFGYFTFEPTGRGLAQGRDLAELVRGGLLRATPIVYEDFLPRSAAGIFQSNLTGDGRRRDEVSGTVRDALWLSGVLGAEVADPFALYAAQQQASVDALFAVSV